MIKLRNLIAMLCIFGATACTENNISFDEVVNVPEGIYLSGSSSEFSVPIEKGRLEREMKSRSMTPKLRLLSLKRRAKDSVFQLKASINSCSM